MSVRRSTGVTDAYAHVGHPRFLDIEDYRTVMSGAGIECAVLCAFDSSPDLAGLHSALTRWPDTFRALGVPLGTDRAEMQAGIQAQLKAGFSGIRLTDTDVIERPFLLDPIGRERRVAVVCGRSSTPECAAVLLRHLERYPEATVVGGHFAGGGDPDLLQDDAVAHLFTHPRFHVVFSRHGGYPAEEITRWAEAVVAMTGWDRLMWGSEAPVLFWRNESMYDAIRWVDRLGPSETELAGFYGQNARRLYFRDPVPAEPLHLPFDPWQRARPIRAGVWAGGLPLEQALAGRLVHGWIAAGGTGSMGDYVERVLDSALPPLPER